MDRQLTGYPSIDKPWLKYYTDEQIHADLPRCKIFEYLWNNNRDHTNDIALNYYGNRITYGELFKSIEAAANAFLQIGVSEGDIVAVIAVTIPETVYILYGLNRIGAIANMIDPRTSAEGIKSYITETGTKTVIVLDAVLDKVQSAIQHTNVTNIIGISPSDSLPSLKKFFYNTTQKKKRSQDKRYRTWQSFIKSNQIQVIKDSAYQENKCCVIVHTGGTSGIPKGVMLSNDNLNCSAFQCINSGFEMKRADRWANIMPPFIAYGVGNGLHLPLVKGMEVLLFPVFKPSKFDDMILKHHPTHMVGVPSHYENVIDSHKLRNKDMSFLITPVVGGDGMRTDLEEKVNSFLNGHGVKNRIVKGYGMTEVSAAVTACFSNTCNKIGSVGVPFAHTCVSIFDPETDKELSYMQEGEVCMTGPNTMIGYYHNDTETKQLLRRHNDGNLWVHSGDLGYMDKDGLLFIKGRIKRIIVRHDGFKVYPSQIENLVRTIDGVHDCCVVGTDDLDHSQGKLPIVYIVANADTEQQKNKTVSDIIQTCQKELPEYAQPKSIIIIDVMPLTPIGKVDYRTLEQMAAKYD